MTQHVTPEFFETETTFRDWLVKMKQQTEMFADKRRQEGYKYTANHLKKVVAELDFALWADRDGR